MFDIGGSELLVIGVVALIVVGPKDLPGMFRTLGRFTAKARGMAREFSRAMEDAANSTGLKETADDLKGLTSKKALGLDALDEAATAFEKWDPKLKGGYTPGPLPDPKAPEPAIASPAPSKPEDQKPAKAKPAKAKPAAAKPAEAKPAAAAQPAGANPATARPAATRKPAAPRKRGAPKGEA